MTTATAEVNITPEMLAQAFWAMGSSQQVQFFDKLADVIAEDHKTNKNAYSMGELQWFYVGDDLKQNRKAREMLMTMAAPLYLTVLRCNY